MLIGETILFGETTLWEGGSGGGGGGGGGKQLHLEGRKISTDRAQLTVMKHCLLIKSSIVLNPFNLALLN